MHATFWRSDRPMLPPPDIHRPVGYPLPPEKGPERTPEHLSKPIEITTIVFVSPLVMDDYKKLRRPSVYPNYSTDPPPLEEEAPRKDQKNHLNVLHYYSQQSMSMYMTLKLLGEYLWHDVIISFLPHTINSCPRPILSAYRDILMKRCAYTNPDRTSTPYESMVDVLYPLE